MVRPEHFLEDPEDTGTIWGRGAGRPVFTSDELEHIARSKVELEAATSNDKGSSHPDQDDSGAPLLRSLLPTERPLIAVPYNLSQPYLAEMERIIEKELLLITSYLTKRLISIDSVQVVLEKLKRALERLQQLEESLRRIDSGLSSNLSQLTNRLLTLDVEPVPNINYVKTYFSFDSYHKRVSWVIADYLARKGYLTSAKALVKCANINDLVDMDLYIQCDEIYKELHAHKLDAVLRWAESQRSSLIGIGSNFLEELKVQEVIICLQSGNIAEATTQLKSFTKDMFERCTDARKLYSAIVFLNTNVSNRNSTASRSNDVTSESEQREESCSSYEEHSDESRSNSIPFVCVYCEERPNVECNVCSRYLELLSDARWELLSEEFERCVAIVYGLGNQSLMENLLRTGFCAIKSTSCEDHRNSTCPACLPEWQEYVEKVPTSHKLNSALICPVTGDVMDYENPAFATPGGYVLSERGIHTLTKTETDGNMPRCPKTKEVVHPDDFKKIFIT